MKNVICSGCLRASAVSSYWCLFLIWIGTSSVGSVPQMKLENWFLGLLKLFGKLIRFNNICGNNKTSTTTDWRFCKRLSFCFLSLRAGFKWVSSSLHIACKTSRQQYFTASALIPMCESHMAKEMYHFPLLSKCQNMLLLLAPNCLISQNPFH